MKMEILERKVRTRTGNGFMMTKMLERQPFLSNNGPKNLVKGIFGKFLSERINLLHKNKLPL